MAYEILGSILGVFWLSTPGSLWLFVAASGTLWPILALFGPFSLSLALSSNPWHSLALFLVLSLALSGIRSLALSFITLSKNLRKNPGLKT